MSQEDRSTVFIDTEGPDEEAIELGLAWVLQLGEQNKGKQNAILALNTKSQLEGVFSDVVGESAANSLSQKQPVQVGEAELQLMTKRIDPSGWQRGPVLALYPGEDLLNKIDSMRGVTDVLVIPWSKDTVQFWIDTWGASALQSDASGDQPEIDDPVAKEAVDTLDALVNTSNGITHSSDRSSCIEIFKTLHSNRISFDPETVRAWLVTEKGWDPDYADDVKEIAESIQAGKRFQYDRGGLADDIFDQWQEQADND
ncbi:DUF1889 family protein [Haloarcula sp. KBTZ06]|uniref:DUF1889 family protein n=1 Tax=Haloarcula sp. KBTZ06 TaxID=3402682 RepID=UPI003B42AF5D